MLAKIIHTIEKITQGSGVFAAYLVLPLVLFTVYEVFARYALNSPTIWAYELGTMITGAYFALGMAYTLKEKAHVRIDVFYNNFSRKTRSTISVIGYIVLFLPIIFWLTFALWGYALESLISGETSGQSAWNPPVWPIRVFIAYGFTVMALQAVAEFIKHASVVLNKPLPEYQEA